MTLQYRVAVLRLQIGGHPHQEFFTCLTTASKRFDELSEQYAFNDVILEENSVKELRRKEKEQKPLAKCPQGHDGLIYGKPLVIRGSDGLAFCKICGWREAG